MLVNVVCALSARFSPHPLLGPPQSLTIDGYEEPHDWKMSDRGHPFACRARGALVDSLSCPTLSVAQACLLLAYEEFGANRDSGLWMYLGISIRMAQDLGIQKRHGPHGPTDDSLGEEPGDDHSELSHSPDGGAQGIEDSKREREDTFWCIYFLDRVISSGTGRPVTLVDEDIQLCFPAQSEAVVSNGWPAPFPPLIRIIHLYGRATDIINGIQDVNDVTDDTVKRLAGLESDLTGKSSYLDNATRVYSANGGSFRHLFGIVLQTLFRCSQSPAVRDGQRRNEFYTSTSCKDTVYLWLYPYIVSRLTSLISGSMH